MKEATGELNSTVLVTAAVALLTAFFFFYLWPIIKSNFEQQSSCAKAICNSCCVENGTQTDENNQCSDTSCKEVTCHLKEDVNSTFKCPYKG